MESHLNSTQGPNMCSSDPEGPQPQQVLYLMPGKGGI